MFQTIIAILMFFFFNARSYAQLVISQTADDGKENKPETKEAV